jgi:adenosylcobyric acid synthase
MINLNLPEEDSLNANPKNFVWTKKNISKIDDEINNLAKIVKSNIDIKSIERMLK